MYTITQLNYSRTLELRKVYGYNCQRQPVEQLVKPFRLIGLPHQHTTFDCERIVFLGMMDDVSRNHLARHLFGLPLLF